MKASAPDFRLPLFLLALAATPLLAAAGVSGVHQYDPSLALAVEQMSSDISARGWHFQVGVNPAMQYGLDHLTGFNPGLKPASFLAHEPGGYANYAQPEAATELPGTYLGVFSSVKNQGGCGSCWAFSTIGAVEGAFLKAHGAANGFMDADGTIHHSCSDPVLSEQQVVSCNPWGWDCNGGNYAFDMLMPANTGPKGYYQGAVPAESFPYVATAVACAVPGDASFTPVIQWGYVGGSDSTPSITAIKAAIYQHGGVSACVYADGYFVAYMGGVFSNTDSKAPINHAILLVGWDDSRHAWLLKNSWGPSWGVDGYMWIAYGANSVGCSAAWVTTE